MSYLLISSMLEVRLNAITPALATAFENVPYVPVNPTPWQRVYLLPAKTMNPTFGDAFKRETGIFQVDLSYPENAGRAAAMARAELIRAQFVRGLTLVSANTKVRVLIDQAPSIAPGMNDTGWYRLPVSVVFIADVFP